MGVETIVSRAIMSLYHLIPSYDERHGLQRQREAGRLALGRRVAAEEREGRPSLTGETRAGKGLTSKQASKQEPGN